MTSDEALLAASLRDPGEFEPLVGRHGAAIHAFLARRTQAGVADDLLADVWLAAFAGRATFLPGLGNVRGWLFGIARNVLAGHYRRAAQSSSAQSSPARAVTEPGRVVDEWDAVDARLDAAATAPRLREALAALPEVDRELLLLVSWEQLTPAEAARALGIPAGTARSRLHRARSRMCEHLDARPQVVDDTDGRTQGERR